MKKKGFPYLSKAQVGLALKKNPPKRLGVNIVIENPVNNIAEKTPVEVPVKQTNISTQKSVPSNPILKTAVKKEAASVIPDYSNWIGPAGFSANSNIQVPLNAAGINSSYRPFLEKEVLNFLQLSPVSTLTKADTLYWNTADLEKEILSRQQKDNKYYGEFDKKGDDILNRTDIGRNKDSEIFLANYVKPNSVIIDIGSALGNNNPTLAGVSVYELTQNPKLKQKGTRIIATDIPSEVKGFENLKKKYKTYPIDYAEVPLSFNTPVANILKSKNLQNVNNVYLRAANSIDLLMNTEETKEHFKHISNDLYNKNVTYLFNNIILYKPANSKTFKKIGNLADAAFDHRSNSWKNKSGTSYNIVDNNFKEGGYFMGNNIIKKKYGGYLPKAKTGGQCPEGYIYVEGGEDGKSGGSCTRNPFTINYDENFGHWGYNKEALDYLSRYIKSYMSGLPDKFNNDKEAIYNRLFTSMVNNTYSTEVDPLVHSFILGDKEKIEKAINNAKHDYAKVNTIGTRRGYQDENYFFSSGQYSILNDEMDRIAAEENKAVPFNYKGVKDRNPIAKKTYIPDEFKWKEEDKSQQQTTPTPQPVIPPTTSQGQVEFMQQQAQQMPVSYERSSRTEFLPIQSGLPGIIDPELVYSTVPSPIIEDDDFNYTYESIVDNSFSPNFPKKLPGYLSGLGRFIGLPSQNNTDFNIIESIPVTQIGIPSSLVYDPKKAKDINDVINKLAKEDAEYRRSQREADEVILPTEESTSWRNFNFNTPQTQEQLLESVYNILEPYYNDMKSPIGGQGYINEDGTIDGWTEEQIKDANPDINPNQPTNLSVNPRNQKINTPPQIIPTGPVVVDITSNPNYDWGYAMNNKGNLEYKTESPNFIERNAPVYKKGGYLPKAQNMGTWDPNNPVEPDMNSYRPKAPRTNIGSGMYAKVNSQFDEDVFGINKPLDSTAFGNQYRDWLDSQTAQNAQRQPQANPMFMSGQNAPMTSNVNNIQGSGTEFTFNLNRPYTKGQNVNQDNQNSQAQFQNSSIKMSGVNPPITSAVDNIQGTGTELILNLNKPSNTNTKVEEDPLSWYEQDEAFDPLKVNFDKNTKSEPSFGQKAGAFAKGMWKGANADNILLGTKALNNLLEKTPDYDQFQRNYKEPGQSMSRGDWTTNQGFLQPNRLGYFDKFSVGTGSMQFGGEVDMTDDEIYEFLAAGGELEFID
jgi:hypothetical protein